VQNKKKINYNYLQLLSQTLTCVYSRLSVSFFKHELCILCYETLYSFNIRPTVIDSYQFLADLSYIT